MLSIKHIGQLPALVLLHSIPLAWGVMQLRFIQNTGGWDEKMGAALGAPVVGGLVGEQHGGPAHTEEAVWNEHRALVAKVPVLRDVLRAHHYAVLVWVHLQEPFPIYRPKSRN